MMNAHSKTLALLAVTSALLVSGCGGGNDADAGSPTAFQAQPAKLGLKDGTADCSIGGPVGTIFIYGGAAPYKISNSAPDAISVSKTQVGSRGGSFDVTALGNGCLSGDGNIFITDNLNNLISVTITLDKT